MPLQGLTESSKVALLKKLVNNETTLKEFQAAAKSIKRKQRLVEAFKRYANSPSWEDLQRRFPKMATEDKLAQFTKLTWKGPKVPMVSPQLQKKRKRNFGELTFEDTGRDKFTGQQCSVAGQGL